MVFLEKFFVIQKQISLSLSKCNKCFIININKPYKLCKLWVLLHLVNTFLMSLISLWKYFLKCHLRSSIWPCICIETSSNTSWKSRIVSDKLGSFYFNLYYCFDHLLKVLSVIVVTMYNTLRCTINIHSPQGQEDATGHNFILSQLNTVLISKYLWVLF